MIRLVTNNTREFAKVPGLALENWVESRASRNPDASLASTRLPLTPTGCSCSRHGKGAVSSASLGRHHHAFPKCRVRASGPSQLGKRRH